MANILHILNGDAPRPAMEQSSVPGTLSAWPDVLHEGRRRWRRATSGFGRTPAALLIRHMWWPGTNAADRAQSDTRFFLVWGNEYIGLLKPEQFGPLFAARRPITAEQIAIGSAAWEAYCSGTPTRSA